MENKYTYFNHNYILPKKFGMDLRYVEFSALVRSGRMTREAALEDLKQPLPISNSLVSEVQRRLGMDEKEFQNIMALPCKTAKNYETYKPTFKKMRPFFWAMYKADLVPKSFYLKYTK